MASNKQYHRVAVLSGIHSFSPLSFFLYDQVKTHTHMRSEQHNIPTATTKREYFLIAPPQLATSINLPC